MLQLNPKHKKEKFIAIYLKCYTKYINHKKCKTQVIPYLKNEVLYTYYSIDINLYES